ncbi:MAG: type II secretion system F family protein [Rhodobacteraceae bacterium]|nr:type II secretion system F family protein [Paracoccaceae bacterium]
MNLEALANSQNLLALLTVIAVVGTVYSLVMPLFEGDKLKSRMKTVAIERDKIRARERQRLASETTDARMALRSKPKEGIKDIVERFNLMKALSDEGTKGKLRMAGYRGTGPLYTFVLARVLVPIALFAFSLFYAFVLYHGDANNISKVFGSIFVAGLGVFGPNIYIKNRIENRQLSIRRAWPDALDLMLICVESGMSIEAAFGRVAEEIGTQSAALAEELTLTNAELSYLGERRMAYENLVARTGVDTVKNVAMALVQAERYGTPVGHALRVLSEDSRDQRMQEAEKKAASLPPKLTVPMIIFFLPVLFAVTMGPVVMQVLDTFNK